jgi:hypothetical protein
MNIRKLLLHQRKYCGKLVPGLIVLLVFVASSCVGHSGSSSAHRYITFVYTSDAHYGITRPHFQGDTNVDSHTVNLAMIKKINTVSDLTLPNDSGIKAGTKVGGVNFLIETGDVANREEKGIQSATVSWKQFLGDYSGMVTLTDDSGRKAKLYLAPGNHDVTNAVGFYRPMNPLRDPASMVGMYNMFMNPPTPKTAEDYNYTTDKVHYSFDFRGIHFTFACIWPDSAERLWLDKDLAHVTNPVLLFVHDEPDVETKQLMNPNPSGTINPRDKFENLLEEKCKDGFSANVPSTIEQRNFALWMKDHPVIKAYFHGNDNANEFYTYRGPDKNIALQTFRVDSPMKGNFSRSDETKLSFQLVIIDVTAKKMTVRECLWDTNPSDPSTPVVFGASKTISL